MDRYRSGAYALAHPRWHDEDALHKARAISPWVAGAPDVVDAGCGAGGVLDALAREHPGTMFEGWDPAPEAIARAATRERHGLRFVLGDFAASELRAHTVLALDVVEHVPDDAGWLTAVANRAERVILRIPLDVSVWDVARPVRLAGVRARYGHVHVHTRETALALLDEAGLVAVEERYDRVPPPLDTVRRRWVDRARQSASRVAPHLAARWLGGFSLLLLARGRAPRTPT